MLPRYTTNEAMERLRLHYDAQIVELMRRVNRLEAILTRLEADSYVGRGQDNVRPYQALAGPVHPEEPFLPR